MSLPIALQLYTVRDVLSKDPDAGLKQVSQIGYRQVEAAGLYGRTPAEYRALLDKHGLTCISAHVGIDQLAGNLDAAIQDARTIGYRQIACPWIGEPYRTPEGYRRAAKELSQAALRLKDVGMTLSYHNHSFEWQKLSDGSRGMDILTGESDLLLGFELDVYWVQHGGDSPVDWLTRLKGRVALVHIKDMSKAADRGFAEVGTGILDFKAIVATAEKIGAKHLIVEQDRNWIDNDPMKSAKIGFANLTRIVAAG